MHTMSLQKRFLNRQLVYYPAKSDDEGGDSLLNHSNCVQTRFTGRVE